MSYYGGTITVAGRNLITSLISGETIEFTRIVVGSGAMPEGVEPIDMTELVTPVADGTSTVPIVENGAMYLTVEYRNDLNGGLKEGFWLREFGIYAKTAHTDEILLYYATLGDSPQPVNAYKDDRIDIRRYPVTIALELDADIQVTYNPKAFLTSSEAYELLSAMMNNIIATVTLQITIPADIWVLEKGDGFPYYADISCNDITERHYPSVSLDKKSLETAQNAGLCPTVQSLNGKLRFWAKDKPNGDITGTALLIYANENKGNAVGINGERVIPIASSTALGGVIIKENSGLKVDEKGSLSIDIDSIAATNAETQEIVNRYFDGSRI
ncbi:MAG: phage tail protein [Eubacterium sp.]|nr:phage tail protein [Eubacterium sp.]